MAKIPKLVKVAGAGLFFGGAAIATALFVPPVRDKVFSTPLWPWKLPWDTSNSELRLLKELCRPGDIIVEANLHSWQWIALACALTRSNWVHAALVDEDLKLLTVNKLVIEADFDIYMEWKSTRLALVRPPYKDAAQAKKAIDYARSKVGTQYDPSFKDQAGNCTGLVASSLIHAGIPIPIMRSVGMNVYAADCFFKIPGAKIIWSTDKDRVRLVHD
jgi:hypothetical protein